MKGSKVLKDLNEVVPGLTKRNERSSKQRGNIGSLALALLQERE